MNFESFRIWLLNRGMTNRTARDVVSRLKRVLNLVGESEVNSFTYQKLLMVDEYSNLSVSIKSQLKRTITLACDFYNE